MTVTVHANKLIVSTHFLVGGWCHGSVHIYTNWLYDHYAFYYYPAVIFINEGFARFTI